MKERLGYHQHRPWRQTHPSRYVRYRRGGRPQRRGRRQASVYDAYSPDGPPQQRQHRARAARDQHERRGLCRQATQGQRYPFRPSPRPLRRAIGRAPGQHRCAVRGVPSSVYRLVPARISARLWLRIVRGRPAHPHGVGRGHLAQAGAAPASARRLGRADHPDGRRRRKRRASCALDDPRPRESGHPSRPVACQYHVPHHQPNARAADCRLLL